jgi:hypothetical protein
MPMFSPFSPAASSIFDDIIPTIYPNQAILPLGFRNPLYNPIVVPKVVTGFGVTNIFNPSNPFYYDSGIGDNPLAQHETNEDLRFKFLDKWLYDSFPDILRMLKIEGNSVVVLSKSAAEKNDISKDSESDLEKKSDFIGREILTLRKNKKILDALCRKNNLKYYDLPHNEHFVRKAQGRYVRGKLEEMQK